MIHLNNGEVICGNVAEKTKGSIRLADAFFIVEDPTTGELIPSGEAASFGLIEIPYSNISSLKALSVGV